MGKLVGDLSDNENVYSSSEASGSESDYKMDYGDISTQRSALRKEGDMLRLQEDPKYKGKRISKSDRDDIFNNYELNSENSEFSSFESEEDEESEESDDDKGNAGEMSQLLQDLEEEDENAIQIMTATSETDAFKGQQVKQQQEIYDQFLHLRILMQKPLTSSYALFQQENLDKIANHNGLQKYVSSELSSCFKSLLNLSEQNFDKKKKKRSHTDLNDAWSYLNTLNEKSLDQVSTVLDDWTAKAQISSSQNGKKLRVINQSMSKQIASVLEDKPRLIERTQLIRKKTHDNSALLDPERFDDSDFYQHLLKEFI